MKNFFTCLLLFTIIISKTFGQDAPAPEYLTGQDFPDSVRNLEMQSLTGGKVSFSKMLELHEGNKVVIDIWASWCKDCLVGLPDLEKLKKKTRKNNVDYVFISVDKDEEKWKSAIARYNIKGEHYRIESAWESTLSNYIVLDWVPRYLVLNEKGRIILPKAITAKNKELVQALL